MDFPTSARSVFISYARADNKSDDPKTKWLDRFLTFLKPHVRQEDFTVCSDRDVMTGDDWHAHIQGHLNGAKAVVLLISPEFLASDYIATNEIPVLLKNAADKGVRIFSLILEPCAYSTVRFKYPDPATGPEEFMLSSLQSKTPPDETLLDMDDAKRSRVMTELAEEIATYLKRQPARHK